jgi:hypothetical protein
MKKAVSLAAMAVCLLTASSYAQGGGGGARMKEAQEKMKSYMKDSLNLSDDQVKKVQTVDEEYRPKQREIFMDQNLSREEKMEKIKALNDEKKGKLKGILTEEQLQKLEDKQRSMMGRGPGGGGQRRPENK